MAKGTLTVFDYTKEFRFAVVRKRPIQQRHYSNFKELHATRGSAETEALRLAAANPGTVYYIAEIQRITGTEK